MELDAECSSSSDGSLPSKEQGNEDDVALQHASLQNLLSAAASSVLLRVRHSNDRNKTDNARSVSIAVRKSSLDDVNDAEDEKGDNKDDCGDEMQQRLYADANQASTSDNASSFIPPKPKSKLKVTRTYRFDGAILPPVSSPPNDIPSAKNKWLSAMNKLNVINKMKKSKRSARKSNYPSGNKNSQLFSNAVLRMYEDDDDEEEEEVEEEEEEESLSSDSSSSDRDEENVNISKDEEDTNSPTLADAAGSAKKKWLSAMKKITVAKRLASTSLSTANSDITESKTSTTATAIASSSPVRNKWLAAIQKVNTVNFVKASMKKGKKKSLSFYEQSGSLLPPQNALESKPKAPVRLSKLNQKGSIGFGMQKQYSMKHALKKICEDDDDVDDDDGEDDDDDYEEEEEEEEVEEEEVEEEDEEENEIVDDDL
jgi:hypothetical protein